MGLDVTAYQKISPAADQSVDSDGEPVDCNAIRFSENHPSFSGRADDIDSTVIYTVGDVVAVWRSPYGAYNRWREELAKLAGYPATAHKSSYGALEHLHAAGAWAASEGPFWELIYFTDCDGHIGTAVSKKLAADFADHQAAADPHPDESFRTGYAEWRAGFEFAADGGAVSFH